ncbi:hypothetical protein ABW636_14200 [Aquimarina sp. 2201CG1-2-11]|uniref:hypothetical protein n=1 Tax=Aquimarina discodermiae TaxID=3231043 RepID=UPI0034628C00
MNFKNVNDAKSVILEGYKMCEKAMKVGDVKTNNQIVKNKITPAYEYLKEKGALDSLIPLLKDDDIGIRQKIAVALLPHYSDICINVLKDIVSMNDPKRSWKAKIVIREWEKNPKQYL